MHNLITTDEHLQQHIEALIGIEPHFSNIYARAGLPALRLNDGGFTHLCKTIVSQQLSVAAADSIWQRMVDKALITEVALLASDETVLRDCGLSKQKIRYIRSLAEHHIDYDALDVQSDDEVIKTLTAVTGIGRWTAEIYLLFSLNRCDVFAHNDLALQVATQAMFDLSERPKERTMRDLAQAWSPHRSAAAYLLWKYYALLKGREGITIKPN